MTKTDAVRNPNNKLLLFSFKYFMAKADATLCAVVSYSRVTAVSQLYALGFPAQPARRNIAAINEDEHGLARL